MYIHIYIHTYIHVKGLHYNKVCQQINTEKTRNITSVSAEKSRNLTSVSAFAPAPGLPALFPAHLVSRQ